MAPRNVRPLETVYRGTKFRSRLEARWAAFFDEIGWRWEYEPFEIGAYIPDFLIFGKRPLLVEVKPVTTFAEAAAVLEPLPLPDAGEPMVVGCSPVLSSPSIYGDDDLAGALRDIGFAGEGPRTDFGVAEALWIRCGFCQAIAVHHSEQSYASRPCGHYDGDSYLRQLEGGVLETAWAKARNATQWRP